MQAPGRKWAILAGAATIAVATVACAGPQASQSASDSALNIYLYQEPAGVFSPLAPASGPDSQVMSFIDESLLGIDTSYHLQPQLAQSYTVSPDATTFTFHLRPGLKWSDGQPFTSKDVLFTYSLLANPKTTSPSAGDFTNVAGMSDFLAGKASTISGFSAPNPDTFVIKAVKPDFGLLALIGNEFIIPQHILGKDSPEAVAKDPFFRDPKVGMGPYTFVSYVTNQYVHVTRNPNYRDPAKIKDVYLKPMSSDAATAQLGNGGIDIASYSPTDQSTVAGFDDVTTQDKPSAGFTRIALDQAKPYFKDVRVRQAFMYALNRPEIVNSVLEGKGTVQSSDFYSAPAGLNEYSQNVSKAKSLLAAAGWNPNRTIQLEWVHGQRDRDTTATIVQSELAAVGVKVKLVNIEAAQITSTYTNHTYDMVLYGGGNYAVSASKVGPITACDQAFPNGANVDFFCDPKLDQLMAQANVTVDATQRNALYDQAAVEDNKQVDLLWLYNPSGLWAINKRVHGFQAPGSPDSNFWDPASWSIS